LILGGQGKEIEEVLVLPTYQVTFLDPTIGEFDGQTLAPLGPSRRTEVDFHHLATGQGLARDMNPLVHNHLPLKFLPRAGSHRPRTPREGFVLGRRTAATSTKDLSPVKFGEVVKKVTTRQGMAAQASAIAQDLFLG
tara:strand:- start:266 stop:676 length:411 start_codon:yes stop_codon:yes gene_type:complete